MHRLNEPKRDLAERSPNKQKKAKRKRVCGCVCVCVWGAGSKALARRHLARKPKPALP